MMVQHLLGSAVDENRWNAVVAMDSNRLLYGTTWYLDLVAPNWEALILGDYEAVWPFAVGKKLGVGYAFRPYGVQQLGVYASRPLQPSDWEALFAAWPAGLRYADVFLNETNHPHFPKGWTMEPWPNRVLDLNQSYERIYQGYSTQLKRNLKKAEQSNHVLFEHDSPEVLLTLFAQNRGKEVKGWGEAEKSKMRQIMYVMLHKRRGTIWTVHDERNSPVAGAFFVESHGRLILLFSATTAWARETGAMTWMLNELIIMKSGTTTWLDFEGSMDKGLDRFYGSFGAEKRSYPRLIFNNLPWPLRWYKKLRP